jgi:putative hydrolase of the HAD superfamily
MLDFKQPFGSSSIFSSDRERSIYCKKKPLGLSSTVEANSTIEADVPYHNLLSNAEKDTLEEHLGRQYLRYWQDDVARLRAILTEKLWFGFDLDDTLHEFRRASGAATHSVLEEICHHSGTSLQRLKGEYRKVLRDKTANGFFRREDFL